MTEVDKCYKYDKSVVYAIPDEFVKKIEEPLMKFSVRNPIKVVLNTWECENNPTAIDLTIVLTEKEARWVLRNLYEYINAIGAAREVKESC